MSVWKATSIEETPGVKISRWTIREITKSNVLPIGSRHIVGWNITEGEGRVSSAIVSFDKERMVATTNSGRNYQLMHDPCINIQAEYVFQAWCRISEVEDWIDVSDQYYTDPPTEEEDE